MGSPACAPCSRKPQRFSWQIEVTPRRLGSGGLKVWRVDKGWSTVISCRQIDEMIAVVESLLMYGGVEEFSEFGFGRELDTSLPFGSVILLVTA